MFKIHQNLPLPVQRTFENVRRGIEPSLYTIYFGHYFDAQVTDLDGEIYPVPYFLNRSVGNKEKAWWRGSMVIDHMTAGVDRTVDVTVAGYALGAAGVVISTMSCVLGATKVLQRFEDEQISLDQAPYVRIGIIYTIDAPPAGGDEFHFATRILWRPISDR
jgi:hypothetical protein